jgi:hypothetical protein
MADDSRWLAYLYQTHPPEQMRRWVPSLRYFRFCRAFGGHAGDGDSLRAAVRATTEAQVRTVLDGLGIGVKPVPDDAPGPVPGVGYRGDAYAGFPRRMGHLAHLAQPGHVDIGAEAAFVWVRPARVEISLHDRCEVTREVVDSAVRIEPLLAPFAADVIDPPLDDPHCVCPKYHPHLWR